MMQATMDILLVEDDEVDREAVRRRLASHFSAREATTLTVVSSSIGVVPRANASYSRRSIRI